MTDKIVVLTTCDTEKRAKKLARALVEVRLAACVNILPKSRSVYRWKQKIRDGAEWVLVIKSRRDLFAGLSAEIARIHSYDVPEIIALPVVEGSAAYLSWMDKELDGKELSSEDLAAPEPDDPGKPAVSEQT